MKLQVVKKHPEKFGDIMSKCLWCEGPVESSIRNGKPKKYCSKVCADKFYAERDKNIMREKLDPPTPCKACGTLVERFLSNNKPKKYCSEKCAKDPQWKKRLKKNAWIDENCISKEEVAKQLGIHTSTVTNRMNKLNIKAHWKIVDGQSYVHVRKIDIDPIKNIHADKKIPDGFVDREEAAKILGVKVITVDKKIDKLKKKLGYSPVEKAYVQLIGKNKNTYSHSNVLNHYSLSLLLSICLTTKNVLTRTLMPFLSLLLLQTKLRPGHTEKSPSQKPSTTEHNAQKSMVFSMSVFLVL